MRLDKIKNTFNDYKVELSFGQLEVIRAALERDHADPVADELLAELHWYLDRVPGPGEEEEDVKARDEHPEGAAEPVTDDTDELPIPMPPREGSAEGGEQPPVPGEEEGQPPAEEEGGGEEGGEEGGPMPVPSESEAENFETDRRLSAPPAE